MTTQVSICIVTYQRPLGIERLLEGINQLTFTRLEPPTIEVVVVDNDASGSAREPCKHVETHFKWLLKYDIEPVKGVSYARNRTIRNASDSSDFIAMLDDDEVPIPLWLEELLLTQREYDADVVSGPVFPHFEEDVPDWIKKGGFFIPTPHPTGKVMEKAFTGNVLVRTKLVKQLDEVFDVQLAIKGSEDTHLFMRLHSQGSKIVWTNEAIVKEWIPASRTNLKWLLNRGYWGWSSYSLFEKEIYPSMKIQATRCLKGVGLIIFGLVSVLPAIFQGKHKIASALLNIYRGFGTLSGLLGLQGQW